MTPFFEAGNIQIYHGDAREVLSELDVEATACVTDPPYGLAFMGRSWDDFEPREYQDWCMEWGEIVMDALVPGAPVLAFSGTRTAHRLTCGLEDAGLVIRDRLAWMYGSGFPKSHDLSGDIAEKEDVDVVEKPHPTNNCKGGKWCDCDDRNERSQSGSTAHPPKYEYPESSDAAKWQSHGTALAPAHEPITLAMKPKDGTFAENALEHGTAGLNIDAARLEAGGDYHDQPGDKSTSDFEGNTYGYKDYDDMHKRAEPDQKGRWPANVVLDEAAAELVDQQSGVRESGGSNPEWGSSPTGNSLEGSKDGSLNTHENSDFRPRSSGGASRFFYTAKASKSDRNAGLPPGEENDHPTVKPTDLMGWLLRLVEMPQRNLILDPFCGSGTTPYVCQQMGLPCVAIDQDEESCELAAKRLSEPSLFSQD